MIELASLHDLDKLQERFDPEHIKKALRHANVKTARKTRTLVSRLVREEWSVKAKDINSHSKILRQKSHSSDVLIFYGGRRLSLMYFDPKEVKNSGGRAVTTYRAKNGMASRAAKRKSKKTGVSIKMKKKRGREVVRGLVRFGGKNSGNAAFMAIGRGNNMHVFSRNHRGRLPLSKLSGPSIPQMIDKKVMDRAFKFIANEHAIQFSNHLEKLQGGIIK